MFAVAVPQRRGIHPNMGGYLFVRLQDRHPPSEQSDEGGCASFSFSMNEKPGGLRYSPIPNYSLYFRSVRQTNSFAPAVPQRRGNTFFGRFLLARLKGPPSPFGVI